MNFKNTLIPLILFPIIFLILLTISKKELLPKNDIRGKVILLTYNIAEPTFLLLDEIAGKTYISNYEKNKKYFIRPCERTVARCYVVQLPLKKNDNPQMVISKFFDEQSKYFKEVLDSQIIKTIEISKNNTAPLSNLRLVNLEYLKNNITVNVIKSFFRLARAEIREPSNSYEIKTPNQNYRQKKNYLVLSNIAISAVLTYLLYLLISFLRKKS